MNINQICDDWKSCIGMSTSAIYSNWKSVGIGEIIEESGAITRKIVGKENVLAIDITTNRFALMFGEEFGMQLKMSLRRAKVIEMNGMKSIKIKLNLSETHEPLGT